MNMTNFPVSYLFDVDQSGAVGGVLHWLQLDVQSRTLATGDVEGGEAVVLAALDARSRVPLLADVAAQLEPAHNTTTQINITLISLCKFTLKPRGTAQPHCYTIL